VKKRRNFTHNMQTTLKPHTPTQLDKIHLTSSNPTYRLKHSSSPKMRDLFQQKQSGKYWLYMETSLSCYKSGDVAIKMYILIDIV
jgi:hypothetical protein